MILQIQLPDETIAVLLSRAQAQGRSAEEVAADALSALFGMAPEESEAPNEDVLARLRQGFADLEAGRTLSLPEAHRALEAAFKDRFPDLDQVRS